MNGWITKWINEERNKEVGGINEWMHESNCGRGDDLGSTWTSA